MRTIHLFAAGALVVAACYSDASQMGTLPAEPPNVMYGPPGGNADPYPQQQYQQPGVAQNPYDQDPSIYQQPADGFQQPADGDLAQLPPDQGDPTAQPDDPKADVTDGEIDATLAPYGSWTDDPDYGRVWRPDPTQVGMDFTPYETGGGWIDSDDGWAFDTSYSWGWLPFHYGRWGWIGGSWGWCPDHHWGSSWVDWRHGHGIVGWRPQMPTSHGHGGRPMESQWRFASQHDFGSRNIHAHTLSPAEGLRVTSAVTRPPFRGATQVHAATVMQNRTHSRQAMTGGRSTTGEPRAAAPPKGGAVRSTGGAVNNPRSISRGPVRDQPTWQNNRQPAYRPAQPAYRQQQPAYRQPAQPAYRQPAYRGQGQAVRQGYRPTGPARGYAPSHSTSHFSGGGGVSHPSSGGSSHSSGGGGSSHSSSGGGGHSSSGGGGGGHSGGHR